ncbi:MAG: metal ABC transporter solute-binding protein, Zn/Mn family, partial [Gemmatimonadota bacterium]
REVHRAALYGALGHPAFPFERAWLPDIREAARSIEVVDTGAGCGAGGEDSHIWLDPGCVLRMTDSLEAALARLLPAEEGAIAEGAATTRERVRQVETEAREILAPHRGRSFMVFHPAWGHFARAFGLQQVAIEAEGKSPSPAELQRLVRRAEEESIGVVFVQPQFSREAAEIVAAEANARVIALDPLRGDWDEGILEAARELADSFGADRREAGDRGRSRP